MSTLKHITVLDLSRLLPGPYASLMLADMGANIIKVEDPNQGDLLRYIPPFQGNLGHFFSILNRNKKSIAINLKIKEGKEIFKNLVKSCDILLEGFRPNALKNMGLGYEDLREINPKLIFCSITGYGHAAKYKDRPGHDMNYLALSGFLYGTETIPKIQLADIFGGSYQAVISILATLIEREKTNHGKFLDISMTKGLFSAMLVPLIEYFDKGIDIDNNHLLYGGYHRYNIFKTLDDRFIAFSCIEEKFWRFFCEKVKRSDLIVEKDNLKLINELKKIFLTQSQAYWIELFSGSDLISLEPVLNLHESITNKDLDLPSLLITENTPIKYIKTPFWQELAIKPAPNLGEHTDEILINAGYKKQELDILKTKGALK
jgi:crotonobetainyl-CoA:carnitine CoA-transferase CaiB-like acyl-CoA transferase